MASSSASTSDYPAELSSTSTTCPSASYMSDTDTDDGEPAPAVVSLLDRLKSPEPAEIARDRKVLKNVPLQ